jgi:hypothetical protein
LSFVIVFSVAGCGGNNGTSANSRTSATTGQAQGVYLGYTSTGDTFESIALPNDKYYALYGTTIGNVFTIKGMITGQGASESGQFLAPVSDYYYTGTTYSGSLKATYSPGVSINGTVSETGNISSTFTGNALPASSFSYNTPASLSDITGTWNGNLFGNSPATVSVTSSGIVSGFSGGCAFSGTVVPDPSNKNFFDISLTYGGSPCLMPNQTQSGIAVDYLLSDGITHQLLAAVSSGSYGNVFVANRTTYNPVVPKFVQQSSFTSPLYSSRSTYTASFSSPVTRGDLLAVAFCWPNALGVNIVSVTDSAGNIYRPILQAHSSYSTSSSWIYAATNVAGGNNVTVTVTVSSPNANPMSMAILEYANVNTIDATRIGAGTGAMPITSGIATTNRPNELILGVSVADVSVTAGTGFNNRFTSSNFSVEDKFVSSQGQYSATFNALSNIANAGWNAGMVTFY